MPSLIQLEIQKLWTLLPHPPGTFVRWFARKGHDRVGGGVDTVEELVLAAEGTKLMNFYVAPNPASVRVGTRHRAAEVTHWSWFLLDIDPVEEHARPEAVVENVLGLLNGWWNQSFDLRRPLIIYSGRGAQVWIRLDDMALDDTIPDGYFISGLSRRTARITNGYWLKKLAQEVGTLYGCRIDTTCADLPRVMRCPGTINTKTGRPALLVVPSAEQFEGLSSTLVAPVPRSLFEPVPVPLLPSGTPWQSVYVHLTIKAQNYLTQGWEEPGRHDTMFHTALCLAERGLEIDEVRRAIQYGNERWDVYHPGAQMALGPEDIEHALATAFRRLQRAQENDTMKMEVHSTTPEEGSDASGV